MARRFPHPAGWESKPDSALKQAHDEIVERLRKDIDLCLRMCERQLVPVGIPVQLHDALREVDRLEGQGRDWEAECDRLAGLLMEASR